MLRSWPVRLLLLILLVPAPAVAQSFSVAGSCRSYIFFSPDVAGLIDDRSCDPLSVGDSPGIFATEVSGGSDRIGGGARVEARGGFGSIGTGVSWSARAVEGASAALFSMSGVARSETRDYLNVGGQAGGGYIPIDITVVVEWDSGLSGNDTRDRNAWQLDSLFRISFASGASSTLPSTQPLELSLCGATGNVFDLAGPGFALTCAEQPYGAVRVVAQGSFQALPQSANLLEYSLRTQGSFGTPHGSVAASDGGLSSAAYLNAMNSMSVFISTSAPGVSLSFASGAPYTSPVPEPAPWFAWTLGLGFLSWWWRARHSPVARAVQPAAAAGFAFARHAAVVSGAR